MSTNEPKHEAPLPGKTEVRPEAWDDRQRVPAGLPDPAVLARMASEFFTSVPGFSQLSRNVLPAEAQALFVPTGPDPLANSWDVTELTARSDVSRPTEAELNALPSTLAGFSAPSSAPFVNSPGDGGPFPGCGWPPSFPVSGLPPAPWLSRKARLRFPVSAGSRL